MIIARPFHRLIASTAKFPRRSISVSVDAIAENHTSYRPYSTPTMKTAAVLSLLVGTAAAFAPQQQSRGSTSLSGFEDALGAQEPLGFW